MVTLLHFKKMETKVTLLDKLKKDVFPGINLFELILFSISLIFSILFFVLGLLLIDNTNTEIAVMVIALVDLPIGVIAATFLSKRSKLAPLLLIIDAFMIGTANFLSHQIAIGIVNMVIVPILYFLAMVWIWPKETNEETNEVVTRKLNLKVGTYLLLLTIIASILFGDVVSRIINNDNETFAIWFDAFAGAITISATIMAVFKFREAWYFYLTLNVIKIVLYTSLIISGKIANVQLLIIAVTYFINALFGLLIWNDSREIELNKSKVV